MGCAYQNRRLRADPQVRLYGSVVRVVPAVSRTAEIPLWEEDRKFISTIAEGLVRLSNGVLNNGSDLPEQCVSTQVPVFVVIFLE